MELTDSAGNTVEMYAYDVIYQLVFVDYNDGNSTDYFYDSLGNRTDVNESGSTTSYSRNELNQYTSVGGEDYDYDDNGNLIDVNTGEYEFAYDCENRLIAANSPDANVTFEYDYLGRRVKKAVEGGATNKYCYDGDQVIAEYENDVLARKFIYGPGITGTVRTDCEPGREFDKVCENMKVVVNLNQH